MMACSDSVTVKFNTVDAGVDGSSTIGAAFLLGLLVAERLAWWVCEGGKEERGEDGHQGGAWKSIVGDVCVCVCVWYL